MNMRANIGLGIASHPDRVPAGLTYRNLFSRVERVIEGLSHKIDAASEKIEQIQSAYFASCTDDASDWDAAYAEFQKVQKQLSRMRSLSNRLAYAVAREEPARLIRPGRRYLKRNGAVTAPIDQLDSRGYLFADDLSGDMYEADGRCLSPDRGDDLIAEIVRQPRAWEKAVA